MKKIGPVLFLFLLLPGVTRAQEYQEVLRNIFYEGEYWLVEESYPDALAEYQKLYTRGYENNANINYRMGICYLNIPGKKEKSIPYLEKAVKNVTPRYKEGIFKETKAPYDAWLYLGNAYRITNELDKAVDAYNTYKGLLDDAKSREASYADKQIDAVNSLRKAMDNPVYVIREHFGENINTTTADFNPVVSYDESMLVYMSSLPFYDAIKVARKVNGEWSEPRQITAELEPESKLFINSISHDGNELYLNQEDNFNSDIYTSSFEDGRWTRAVPLNKEVNTKFWESHASISGDGQELYLASNRKDGLGGMDIWMSKMGPAGWQEPQNLGPLINTELGEDNPFISDDGRVLYFASQGHYNFGGYDLFYTEKQPDGSWSEPRNLGYPLNTSDDDIFFMPVDNGKYGYQSLFGEDNLGSSDIYRTRIFKTEAEYLAAVAHPAEPEVIAEPEETTMEEQPVEEQALTEEPAETVVPVIKPQTVMYVIRPVFFGFDRFDLTNEAKTTLNDLVEILKTYPMLEVNAIGHTDNKGSEAYNMMLSKKRSANVVQYITRKGIDGKRIQSLGKGESQPVARNSNPDGSDSPEGRQLNRRVEILVVKPDLPNVKVEEVKVPGNLKK
jgi:outer membrane protein OmpA-like peptidoglycan-associated protein/tetratricopeptide (TPR) repeat protein